MTICLGHLGDGEPSSENYNKQYLNNYNLL